MPEYVFAATRADRERCREVVRLAREIYKIMQEMSTTALRQLCMDAMVHAFKDNTETKFRFKEVSGLTYATERTRSEWTGTVTHQTTDCKLG